MKEIQDIIDKNDKSPENLHIFLSSLKDQKRNFNKKNNAKEMELYLIATLCKEYKLNLIDTLDKTLLKTCKSVIELILSYFIVK